MQLDPTWRPTKYVQHGSGLKASRDSAEVGVGSRMIADLTARFYDHAIARHARGRLLDLGCGKAPLYGTYAPRVDHVLRVDWGESMHGNAQVDVLHDLTKPLPFEDEQFDTIIFSDVLEHLPEPENSFADLTRVLARNGVIIMNTPFFYLIHEEPHDYYRYTQFALRKFADDQGLEVVELKPLGGAPEVCVDIISKLLGRGWLGRQVAAFTQGTYSLLSKAGLLKGLSERTAARFPISYGMIARKPVQA